MSRRNNGRMTPNELLTDTEQAALKRLAELISLINSDIIGHGATREQDKREVIAHVHALQQMIMAQAAARAYPDSYRLLGE